VVVPLSTGLYLLDVGLGRGFAEPVLLLESPASGLDSILRSGDLDGDQIDDLVVSAADGTRIFLSRAAERGAP
jgi:hypothetical protein